MVMAVTHLIHPEKAAQLFEGWQETIIWSCLQGVMGAVYADDEENRRSAMAVLGDFCFLAGEPGRELLEQERRLAKEGFRILVPRTEGWERLIEKQYREGARRRIRYAFKKEGDRFDRELLRQAASFLESGYTLRFFDAELYSMCKEEAWSRDLVSQFPDYETYRRLGAGAAVLHDGRLIAGASAYARYREGIEIEIDTRESHRRQGFAFACGAALILECLERGLYPSWDAHNEASAALAAKLGYRLSHTYTVYEIGVSD